MVRGVMGYLYTNWTNSDRQPGTCLVPFYDKKRGFKFHRERRKNNTNHILLVNHFNMCPKSETNEQECYRKSHSASSMATIFQSLKTDAEGNVDYFAYLAAFTDLV